MRNLYTKHYISFVLTSEMQLEFKIIFKMSRKYYPQENQTFYMRNT